MMDRPIHARGFTFIEVMFAVVVLGIGMIGLAGALSVGASTVQNTFDESTAARVAASAYATLSHTMTKDNTLSVGKTFVGIDFSKTLQEAVQLELILSSDHRYAWIPFYQRDGDDSTLAQVVVVVTRCESGSEYTSADVQPANPDASGVNPPTLNGHTADVVCDVGLNGGPDTITFDASSPFAVPGAIVVTKTSDGTTPSGRILKIGELLNAKKRIWSLAPGFDLRADGAYTGSVFVVGRAYADPNTPAGGFAGASQAVAAYSMMVQLH